MRESEGIARTSRCVGSLLVAALCATGCRPSIDPPMAEGTDGGTGGPSSGASSVSTVSEGTMSDTVVEGCPNETLDQFGWCFERVDFADGASTDAVDLDEDGIIDLVGLVDEELRVLFGSSEALDFVAFTIPPVTSANLVDSGHIVADGPVELIRVTDSTLERYRWVEDGVENDSEPWPRLGANAIENLNPLIAIDNDDDGSEEVIALHHLRRRQLDLDYNPLVVVDRIGAEWLVTDGELDVRPEFAVAAKADLEGNGRMQLVIGSQSTNPYDDEPYDPERDEVAVLEASPSGLVVAWSGPAGVQHHLNPLALGDVDGDGLLDIVIPEWAGNRLAIMTNLGGLQFSDPVLVDLSPVSVGSLAIGDVDLDGSGDVFVSEAFGGEDRLLLLNDMLGTPEVATVLNDASSVSLVTDVNGDGRGDVALWTTGGDPTQVTLLVSIQ